MIDVRPEVAQAIMARRPVVALESTLIAHGLPWPANVRTARNAEAAVRAEGAVPATIAVVRGCAVVGLAEEELESIARDPDVLKAGRRDLPAAIAQRRTAATTVSATMFLAERVGIRLLATGGIGGAHRGAGLMGDISADLTELSRTAAAVVCAGAKAILDLPLTLEILETLAVPVVGFGTDDFPAFYIRSSGRPVSVRLDREEDVACFLRTHWQLDGGGVVIAQPPPADSALNPGEVERTLVRAEEEARERRITGGALTPFLLGRLAEMTNGRALQANEDLIVANARLTGRLARAWAAEDSQIR